jgi:hypothetical protein
VVSDGGRSEGRGYRGSGYGQETGGGGMMNAVQKAYIKAKAVYETTEGRVNQVEAGFLKNHGRAEKHIWAIDDESVFDRLNNEFSETFKNEETALVKARMDLELVEDALITFGLSIIPSKYKKHADALRSSRDITVRQKIINLTMSLDTRTVPKCIA